MFNDEQFVDWCRNNNLPEAGREFLMHVRASEPARRVRSGRGNVISQYPSKKMGFTLQAESHRNELVWLRRWDLNDNDVLEIWDQPATIKLSYEAKSGRAIAVRHTPDYLLIRSTFAELVECKPEEKLRQLADEQPRRYAKIDGVWRCPPAEEALLPLSIRYRIVSTDEINPIEARNIVFLEDYFRADRFSVTHRSRIYIAATVSSREGVLLSDLIIACADFQIDADDIYGLIITGDIYVDLESSVLAEPYAVPVFSNEEASVCVKGQLAKARCSGPVTIDLQIGTRVVWDNNHYQIVNVAAERIWLKPHEGDSIPIEVDEIHNLIKAGSLRAVPAVARTSFSPIVGEILSRTPERALQQAYKIYQSLQPLIHGGDLQSNLPERTRRRNLAKYRQAEQLHGCGFVGLIPNYERCGRPKLQWPAAIEELLSFYTRTVFEHPKQQHQYAVYSQFKTACEERGFTDVPCYKTFWKRLRARPIFSQTARRKGAVAAYKYQFYYWLDKDTPRHGDRPFEICHIDHTQLDVEIISSINGENLGRPWITFMVDAYSRRILAVYLTFDEPSYRSCMMVIRECVRRWGRLPQTIVVDHGADFQSTFFDVLTAAYKMTKKTRSARKPRHGTVVERVVGSSNTEFIHNLVGNTQLMRGNVREVTREVEPRRQAIWTLSALYKKLCEWAYEVYDARPHWTLKQSPRNLFDQGITLGGQRQIMGVAYDEEFKLYTLPGTPKGVAKINIPRGVKINNFYYWCEDFRDPEIQFKKVPVRFDPHDISTAYVFVHGSWVKCYSEETQFFHWRTEREIKLAAAAMRRLNTRFHQNTFSLTARSVADFLRSINEDEAILKDEKLQALRRQHLKDLESRSIITAINGEQIHVPVTMPDLPATDPDELFPVAEPEEPPVVEESVCDNFELAEAS
ncbi:MAG TPA: DDE-type integrase/transposase/recombinase [Pyrinomonadaceae bacterium]|nr:DDE-type integrase/transposase/recombinase [Pyrinomonadaceae bacterium]